MKDNIINTNEKGEWHGYVELYNLDGLTVRGNSKNNYDIGYQEYHIRKETEYYIK